MTVIKVENLSKKYIISHQKQERYTALRDVITNKAKGLFNSGIVQPLKRLNPNSTISQFNNLTREEFYALRDVSFEIKQGERVGIIGRNGAGKSTLLKILSRITEPTTGRIEITGRVASLLEVGTGFHPELTGRENIFLNGAIMGMGKAEIKRKFDEIVAFAEIEKFLDTPVKRYSSGMYVRLAFAVAAHLEPEILIVDEVLAVGDAQFQKKCLGKMEEVGKEGRTVLFVSHNMGAVRKLCQKGIFLKDGSVFSEGTMGSVVDSYLSKTLQAESANIDALLPELLPDPAFKLKKIRLSQGGVKVKRIVENGKPLEIIIEYQILQRTVGLRVFFDILDDQTDLLLRSFHDEDHDNIPTMEAGHYRSIVIIPPDFLGPIDYTIAIKAGIYNQRYCLPISGIQIPIKGEQTGIFNRAYPGDPFQGKLAMKFRWETTKEEEG